MTRPGIRNDRSLLAHVSYHVARGHANILELRHRFLLLLDKVLAQLHEHIETSARQMLVYRSMHRERLSLRTYKRSGYPARIAYAPPRRRMACLRSRS